MSWGSCSKTITSTTVFPYTLVPKAFSISTTELLVCLKFGFLEGGGSWVLFLDFHHQSQLGVLPASKLRQRPSKPA